MRRLWLIFSQATTVALAVLFVVGTLKPHWLGLAGQRSSRPGSGAPLLGPLRGAPGLLPATAGGGSAGTQPREGFAAAARAAAPAVVSVTTSIARSRNPHADDPNFNFFFGERGQPQAGFGSGVIVSADGLLLTNHHVVDNAREIDIRLADGREVRAEVVGTDPETDLAVLRIPLDKLPAVALGRSGALQVGDAVLAIGNPFNVGQTVTMGIVSALGRNGLGLSTFESFIQTDAAINPGNSGGALVDAQGQLVGINTAIYSRSGGSMGIGFAIPVDVARRVMDDLLRDGEVRRGWIGVEPRDLTPEFVENFKLEVNKGVLITGVLQDGPAYKGGVKPGDVVLAVAGQPVASVAQLLNTVAALPPGKPATLQVQRGSKALALTVDVVQRKPQLPRRQPQ
ncbi:S1C family serine protease [Aquabacterium sp. OR-4]|uniref:S1C family serine protease n=1 Tax=Aquabacterium sp. OR-4 TaxID=2978127 RepID=UPI0021B20BF2|nr:trypsin-like peptidase domain-containing protein [Aquabacterium sp. OR-4]MDT7834574.1 trypsin-like peptidase domain-containing protein [Aquabacterium sp. OR-4]